MARLIAVFTVPPLLVVIGAVGYRVLEGWRWLDCFFMAVTTLATVGYGEVHPLSSAGRIFSMVYILGGVFTIGWAASEVIRAVVSGELNTALGRQRLEKKLSRMRDHVLVCGYGRMGRLVCQELSHLGLPFVVIDRDAEALAGFDLPEGIALAGEATSDEVLRAAGIERARALAAVLSSDADNLYVTMSARLLSEGLFVVARGEGDTAESKLKRAGASRVISPYVIGGQRMAHAIIRPAVVDFIELATRSQHLDLQIEEVVLDARSSLCATLREGPLTGLHVIVVAVLRPTGEMVFKPGGEAVLAAGDKLILLGSRGELDKVEVIARG
jgi:voltage-gated potassium channel